MRKYVGVIIQARLTSSRFPKKILADLNGRPLLEHLVERCRKAKYVDKVIIASPHSPECCLNEEIFIGSENDVLDRYYQAAKKYQLDVIVRLTSDCPIIPVIEIERCIKHFFDSGSEYVTNRPSVPDGWDIEVISFKALEDAWKQANEPYDREHVTPWIKRNATNQVSLEAPKLSVDTEEDLENVRRFYESERQNNPSDGWNGQLCNQFHTSFTGASYTQSDTNLL